MPQLPPPPPPPPLPSSLSSSFHSVDTDEHDALSDYYYDNDHHATPHAFPPPAEAVPPLEHDVMALLWGDAQDSTSLAAIRDHAHRAIDRVLAEDPYSAYIPMHSKLPDVRLYKMASRMARTALDHERCDFRGVTRVPGTLEGVVNMLSSEDARESYWVALNTQRGLLTSALLASARTEPSLAPFPRWSHRYMATKFSKQSSVPPVEACYAEYATFYPDGGAWTGGGSRRSSNASERGTSRRTATTSVDASLRRAFIYRRSMDHRQMDLSELREPLERHGEWCEKMLVQDWLFEVSETSEPHTCKLVLSCSVFLTGSDTMRAMRAEFQGFCTNILLNMRRILVHQRLAQLALANNTNNTNTSNATNTYNANTNANDPSHPNPNTAPMDRDTRASRRSRSRTWSSSWSSHAGSHVVRCEVCSSRFSLLKKRYLCNACGFVVCSHCCSKTDTISSASTRGTSNGLVLALGSSSRGGEVQSRRGSTRECILCQQFGADGSMHPHTAVGLRRPFTSSVLSSPPSAQPMLASTSETDDDVDLLVDDDEPMPSRRPSQEKIHIPATAASPSIPPSPAPSTSTTVRTSATTTPPSSSSTSPQGMPNMTGRMASHILPPAFLRSESTPETRRHRLRAATEDHTRAWRDRDPTLASYTPTAPTATTPQRTPTATTPQRTPLRRHIKPRGESFHTPRSQPMASPPEGVVLLSDIETLSLSGSFHRVGSSSSRGSTAIKVDGTMGSVAERQRQRQQLRASRISGSAIGPPVTAPAMPSKVGRRAIRSVSEDTTLPFNSLPLTENEHEDDDDDDDGSDDDLANFTLEMA